MAITPQRRMIKDFWHFPKKIISTSILLYHHNEIQLITKAILGCDWCKIVADLVIGIALWWISNHYITRETIPPSCFITQKITQVLIKASEQFTGTSSIGGGVNSEPPPPPPSLEIFPMVTAVFLSPFCRLKSAVMHGLARQHQVEDALGPVGPPVVASPAPVIISHDGVVKLLHHPDHYLVICNIDFMLLYW